MTAGTQVTSWLSLEIQRSSLVPGSSLDRPPSDGGGKSGRLCCGCSRSRAPSLRANKERPGSCYEIRIALRPAVSDPFFLRPTLTIRETFAVCDVSGVLKNSLSIVPAANSAFALGCGCGSRHLSARFCSFPKRALSAGGTGAGRGWQLWTDARVPSPTSHRSDDPKTQKGSETVRLAEPVLSLL